MAKNALNAKLGKVLLAVNAATLAGSHDFRSMDEMQPIIDFGNKEGNKPLVQFNAALKKDGDTSKIAFVTTDAGKEMGATLKAAADAKVASKPAVDPNAPKPTFEIETVTDLPEQLKRNPRESVYPFADLAAPKKLDDGKVEYASFFVAAPADITTGEAMAKKFASTVSSATKRYTKEGSTDVRKFTLRATTKDGKVGVRVFRIE